MIDKYRKQLFESPEEDNALFIGGLYFDKGRINPFRSVRAVKIIDICGDYVQYIDYYFNGRIHPDGYDGNDSNDIEFFQNYYKRNRKLEQELGLSDTTIDCRCTCCPRCKI